MTYDSDEISAASGRPVELYTLAAETGQTWRYCSLPEGESVTHIGHEYTAENIQRDSVKNKSRSHINELEVIFGRNNEFALQFVAAPIEGRITLTVTRGHGSNFIQFWQGDMLEIRFDGEGKATGTFAPRSSSSARVGKRRMCTKMCPHVLYGNMCGVNDAAYRVSGTLSSVSGKDLVSATFSGYSDGHFTGGKIVIGYAKRLVVGHTTNTVTVDRIIADAAAGSSFGIYPGCDKSPSVCHNKFNNKINYGGLENLPTKNCFGVNINDLSQSTVLQRPPGWRGIR